jgi:flagellar FliJ protein
MKKFRFPLRPVAILRAHYELRAREAFAVAVHAYVEATERHLRIRARLEELEGILFQGRRDRFNASETAAFYRAYRQECAAEMQAAHAATTARAEMNSRRDAYLEANRKVKVVTRLEEQARTRHRIEAARVEQTELDEFASYRAYRNRQPVLMS